MNGEAIQKKGYDEGGNVLAWDTEDASRILGLLLILRIESISVSLVPVLYCAAREGAGPARNQEWGARYRAVGI
jgi:hypothetical protein